MSEKGKIVRNTFFLYVRMLLIMGVSLYTSRVILRVLGIDDFGIYNVVGGIVTMFTFLNGSLSAATSRYITFELGRGREGRANEVFNVALLIHLALSFIIVLLSETVGLWFFYEKMNIPPERLHAAFIVYQISVVTTFVSVTQVPYNAMIIAHENMSVYAYVGIFEAFGKLGIALILAHSPIDRLVFYALLLCALQVSVMVFYRLYCGRHFKETSLKLYRDKTLYKEMFSYAGSDLIGQLSIMAQGQGLNLLLNVFFGPAVNAARAIAYQVQGIVTQFSNNFMTAVKPQIIKRYADGRPDDMMKLVRTSSKFSYYLMWLIVLPVMLESDYLLKLWLGEYPEYTVQFLRLVLLLCLIQTLKSPRTTAYHATGHIRRVNLIVGTILCCALPLGYVFLKSGFRAESVFWAAIISMLVSELVSVLILKRYVRYSAVSYVLDVHVRCAVVSAVSVIIPLLYMSYAGESGAWRLVMTCAVTALSSLLTIWTIGLDTEMRGRVKEFIKNRFGTHGRKI